MTGYGKKMKEQKFESCSERETEQANQICPPAWSIERSKFTDYILWRINLSYSYLKDPHIPSCHSATTFDATKAG